MPRVIPRSEGKEGRAHPRLPHAGHAHKPPGALTLFVFAVNGRLLPHQLPLQLQPGLDDVDRVRHWETEGQAQWGAKVQSHTCFKGEKGGEGRGEWDGDGSARVARCQALPTPARLGHSEG